MTKRLQKAKGKRQKRSLNSKSLRHLAKYVRSSQRSEKDTAMVRQNSRYCSSKMLWSDLLPNIDHPRSLRGWSVKQDGLLQMRFSETFHF